jgi:hypothetical protein
VSGRSHAHTWTGSTHTQDAAEPPSAPSQQPLLVSRTSTRPPPARLAPRWRCCQQALRPNTAPLARAGGDAARAALLGGGGPARAAPSGSGPGLPDAVPSLFGALPRYCTPLLSWGLSAPRAGRRDRARRRQRAARRARHSHMHGQRRACGGPWSRSHRPGPPGAPCGAGATLHAALCERVERDAWEGGVVRASSAACQKFVWTSMANSEQGGLRVWRHAAMGCSIALQNTVIFDGPVS